MPRRHRPLTRCSGTSSLSPPDLCVGGEAALGPGVEEACTLEMDAHLLTRVLVAPRHFLYRVVTYSCIFDLLVAMKENFKHVGKAEQLNQGESDWLVAVAQRSGWKANLSSGRVTATVDHRSAAPVPLDELNSHSWAVAQWNWWGTRHRDPKWLPFPHLLRPRASYHDLFSCPG